NNKETTSTIVAPLRLLSITPPPPKGRRFTSASTIAALQNIATAGPVIYRSLTDDSTTLKNIKEQLELFQPQFVHFEGHVISGFDPDEGSHVDFFVTLNEPILVEEFARLLKENSVQLLMIGRSEIRPIYGAQVTLKLSQQGLPA